MLSQRDGDSISFLSIAFLRLIIKTGKGVVECLVRSFVDLNPPPPNSCGTKRIHELQSTTGLTTEVKLRNCTQAMKHGGKGSSLALKPRAHVIQTGYKRRLCPKNDFKQEIPPAWPYESHCTQCSVTSCSAVRGDPLSCLGGGGWLPPVLC